MPDPGLPGPEVQAAWCERALPPTGSSWYTPPRGKPAAPFPPAMAPQLFFLPVWPFRTHFRSHLLGTPAKALLPVLGSKEAPPATCSSTAMRVGRVCCCLSGWSQIQKEQVQGASSTLLELLPCGAPAWGTGRNLERTYLSWKTGCACCCHRLRQMGV